MQSCTKSFHLAIRIHSDLEMRIKLLEMALFPLVVWQKHRLFFGVTVKRIACFEMQIVSL